MKTAVGRQLPHNEVIWKMYGSKICFPFLCNLGNGENVLCSSKAIVMKHIRKKNKVNDRICLQTVRLRIC